MNVNVNPCVGNPENIQPLIDLCLIMDNFDGTVADSDGDNIKNLITVVFIRSLI